MTVAISWLTIYSLDRFDVLQSRYTVSLSTNLEDMVLATQTATLRAVVDVINELQFIGAAVSGVALLVALLLRGGRRETTEVDAQTVSPGI
jgi:hypothetical protein